MPLARYLVRRALFALILVAAVSSAAIVLTLAAPADIAEDFGRDRTEIAKRRAALGLDDPARVQFTRWLRRIVRLDMGESAAFQRPVADLVGERALNTAILASAALLAATVVGIPLGVYTGSRRRGAGVRAIRLLSILFLSMPPLLASLALVMLAARTGWFPIGGMLSAGAADADWTFWLTDLLRHLALPAVALALPLAAVLERLQSQALTDAAGQPFVQAAQARGLSADHALLKHGWRVSLGAVLGLYGLMIGSLFSGSFVVEVVTAWPGLGRLMYDALRTRDLYLVAGCAATGALFLALGTLLSDVLLAVADPRSRAGARP
jgi:peptide/nickel transport system permease protein